MLAFQVENLLVDCLVPKRRDFDVFRNQAGELVSQTQQLREVPNYSCQFSGAHHYSHFFRSILCTTFFYMSYLSTITTEATVPTAIKSCARLEAKKEYSLY